MEEQKQLNLSTGKQYELEHRTAGGGVQKVEGKLISLDENGFVVIESNGRRILIKKDLVEILREKSE
jgi:ribosome maturation factor RimP